MIMPVGKRPEQKREYRKFEAVPASSSMRRYRVIGNAELSYSEIITLEEFTEGFESLATDEQRFVHDRISDAWIARYRTLTSKLPKKSDGSLPDAYIDKGPIGIGKGHEQRHEQRTVVFLEAIVQRGYVPARIAPQVMYAT